MTDPIAITLSAISIAASAWLTIETQLRRARMRITILRPPANWSVGLLKHGIRPGVWSVANLDDAEQIQLVGVCPALIGNEGPKGGAVWDAQAEVVGLGDPWRVRRDVIVPQPYTLAGKTYAGLEPSFALSCPIAKVSDGIRALGSTDGQIHLRITYNRHGWFGRSIVDQTEACVDRGLLLFAFKDGAAANGVDLRRLQLDPWLRQVIEDTFAKYGLKPEEHNSLRQAVWMAVGPEQQPLTYPVDGEDGTAVLHFRDGWTGIGVAADGRHSTLREIASAHKDLVSEVRHRLEARDPA